MAMIILSGPVTVQGSPEWLAWRLKGIGGSDAPIIMGKSLYMRAYELFKQKTGKATAQKPNPILDKIRERGHLLEPLARAAFERETGDLVSPIVGVSATHAFIRSSFDAYDPFKREPTEIKCPGERAHAIAVSGKVPDEYIDQIQHEIFVAESDWANYYSFDGDKGVLVRVARDQKRIDQIVASEEEFWDRVRSGVWETNEWVAASTNYLMIKKEMDDLKTREAQARQALVDLIPPGKDSMEGCGLLVTKSGRAGNVDYAKILADRNITLTDAELDAYRGSGTSDVTRVTVTRDLDVTSIDAKPLDLNLPKIAQIPAGPSFDDYVTPTDFVI
ncbi:endonuclease (plasmid) [Burkholderia sp. KK1]|uniref:Phage-type endonuclease n=1 Tax=Burkholderia sp. M701 TaxID=326454 RepID=V5YNA4_9BURK|nr:YqaJ viral recombinase family protein [Burkholderia sp. M701]AQH05528.1 endonuclease [Burkholderia sp. KK1]BAO18798.1 putative phage-type endonuclease [Burkholderia sp. M701]